MQAYSQLNAILRSPKTDYSQFQAALMNYDIEQQTYLNLFLTTVAIQKARHPQFAKYVHLLTHFRHYTGKKSADINYLGYKDRISVLMHTCARGNAQSISTLLAYSMLDLQACDPNGKNAAFYAIKNANQQTTNLILILLFQHHPQYIRSQTANGCTLVNEAIDELKYSTVELLLRVGGDPNSRLQSSGNTICHEVVKLYIHHKELVNKLIVILIKYKANFEELNGLGKTVFETAKDVGLNLSECVSFYHLLEREESVDDLENQFDKQSIITLNQQTKIEDSVSVSEIFDIQSNVCSQKVDFSELDYQYDIENEVHPQKEEAEMAKAEADNVSEDHSKGEEEGDSESNSDHQINFQLLSEQILKFYVSSEQQYRTSWELMQPFFKSIQRIAQKYGLTLEIVGSFVTGLWSSYSDINMNLIPVSTDYINFQSVLERIYKKLKARRLELSIDNILLNKNKINSIKLQLGPKYNNQKLDIGIFHRNNQNRNYVNFITENMEAHPEIKPLFFVSRKLCESFNLHDPLQGGLKTYTLFLMINLVVKSIPTNNIGHLFYHLTLYYGFYFQYDFQAKDAGEEQQVHQELTHILDFPQMRFNLMDPLNPKNNMGGKSTRTQQMQNMFRAVYYHLCALSSQPYLDQLFQLHSIF